MTPQCTGGSLRWGLTVRNAASRPAELQCSEGPGAKATQHPPSPAPTRRRRRRKPEPGPAVRPEAASLVSPARRPAAQPRGQNRTYLPQVTCSTSARPGCSQPGFRPPRGAPRGGAGRDEAAHVTRARVTPPPGRHLGFSWPTTPPDSGSQPPALRRDLRTDGLNRV